MSTPTFAKTHNLVAFLEKPSESKGFEQIIDFPNAKSIRYALTVNPTVYALCVKQFWTIARVKKINGQEQIQALVDKQKVIITEESIRRDLKFDDAEGIACLPNDTIFLELARMGNVTPLFETIMVNAQEEVGLYTDSYHTPTDTQPSSSKPQKKIKPKRKQRQATEVHSPSSEIPGEESIPTPSNDPLPSGDDNKFGVDELEGIEVIVDVREKIVKKEVTTADPVSTAGEVVIAASVDDSAAPTTATTTDVDDELTLEKTLIAIKSATPKVISTVATIVTTAITTPRAIGIVFHEQVQAHIPTVSSSKDKCKAKMIEPEKPLKKKDQIALDEDMAQKLEAKMKAKMEEEERIAREKDEVNRAVIKDWDDVQAAINADRQLAEQIQAQEREQLSIKERSKLLAELIESRRKYFAAKRAEEIRNKPPTKA
nr:xylulose kinase-1 [Tanacetum cinerariifolium]